MYPACHPLLVGLLSHQGFVNIVGVLITQLRPYRCNCLVVYLCPEEHRLSADTSEPVCSQYNFGFQIIFGA